MRVPPGRHGQPHVKSARWPREAFWGSPAGQAELARMQAELGPEKWAQMEADADAFDRRRGHQPHVPSLRPARPGAA